MSGVIDLRTVKRSCVNENGYRTGYGVGFKHGMRAVLSCFRSDRSDIIEAMFEQFLKSRLNPWVNEGYFDNPPRVRCANCGRSSQLEIDHIVPKSLGGEDTLENFQFLCRQCNAMKGNHQ